jgi:hypothetical protein
LDLRDEIEAFSGRMLGKIMDIVEPKKGVTIDLDSLRHAGDATTPDLLSSTAGC